MNSKEKFIEGTLISLKELEKEKEKYEIELAGKKFFIFPEVFSPKYFKSPEFSINNIQINEGDNILEIGCGAGIFSVLAALKGASKVVAIDVNPNAVENTRENAKIHGVEDKITALIGDVYSPLSREDKFDLIFWNVPFLFTNEKEVTVLEKSVFDPGYESIKKFILESLFHLKSNGRLILEFSPAMGNYGLLKQFMDRSDLNFKEIKRIKTNYGGPIGEVDLILLEGKRKN